MTDEEITYASVTFKARKQSKFTAEREETVYDEVKVNHKNPPGPNGALLQEKNEGEKSRLSQLFHPCCGILYGFLIMAVIGLFVYFSLCSYGGTDELIELKTNQTKLLENSQNQTRLQNALLSDYENLRKDHRNLTALWSNLMDSFMDLQTKLQNISAQNLQLVTQNEDLKTETVNLRQQKDNMEAEWNKLNDSRAQWSVDAYCPKDKKKRECKACQKNWTHLQTKCYKVNQEKMITWRQAQQDCQSKNSQLLLLNKVPKKITSVEQFWIGLSVENGKWRWINGSTLLDLSKPLVDGHCAAVSVKDNAWKSVDCNGKSYWICEKEPLSL
uniref:C-type lectin domain-containing protein n=1 Tax=Oryzias latipes TaxID=8090 RepID=A0A3P9L528_ORYLA